MNWAEHQHEVHESRQRVDFEMLYVDMANGDVVAGLMLAQIDYWHSLDRNGHTRLRVKKEGHLWLAKARHEWWDEIRISPKQVDRALEVLVDLGLIEKKLFRFAGSPTVHIRILTDAFMEAYNRVVNTPLENPYAPKVENGNSPKVEIETDQTGESLTETTTEITAEPTFEDDDKDAQKLGRILSIVDDRLGLDRVGIRVEKIKEFIEQYGIDHVLAGAEEFACSRAGHINYIGECAKRAAQGKKGPKRARRANPKQSLPVAAQSNTRWG